MQPGKVEFRRHRVRIRGRIGNRQGTVDEDRVLLRLGGRSMRARLFLAHLAGWGLLGIVLLRALLGVSRGRWLLGS